VFKKNIPLEKNSEILLKRIALDKLPAHIAIIMDDNGRWAKKRGLPRTFGHKAGIKSVRTVVETCAELRVACLTLYAFSTENWLRPKTEVLTLMRLLRAYLRRELPTLMKNNIRLRAIGDLGKLPHYARAALDECMGKTSQNTGLLLVLALNYGARQEILQAVNACMREKPNTPVTEEAFQRKLYTADMPDPDLLIRTSGEMRISNFLLWQIAYTELYVTKTLWPDFDKTELYTALIDYQGRVRRFGGVS
jgi:undecaprenyl diphosphate synthase